jgi:hypothetical protein
MKIFGMPCTPLKIARHECAESSRRHYRGAQRVCL